MKRINVIGTSGSGKSTFSAALAAKLDSVHVEMDDLFWASDWKENTEEKFFRDLKEHLSTDTWVVDGNYTKTIPLKWELADTVIWIDYSYFRTFFQILKRSLVRGITKQVLWDSSENRESIYRTFFTKDSVILWMLTTHKKNRLKYLDLMKSEEYQHINFVHLKSPKGTRRFLNNVENA